MEPEEKQFYVLLTIFGSMFGIGPFIAFEASGAWGFAGGCAITVFGLGGLLMLMRDRLRIKERVVGVASHVPLRTSLTRMGVVGVWILVATLVYSLHGLRSDINAYIAPRTLSEKQIAAIHSVLSSYDPHAFDPHVAVSIIASTYDEEAANYATELMRVIEGSGWGEVYFAPVDPWSTNVDKQHFGNLGYSLVLQEGIIVWVSDPVQARQADPQHPTPGHMIERALDTAGIAIGGSGAKSPDHYYVTIAVGHRPFNLVSGETIRQKLVRWIRGF